jgi:glycosyltransferase 2 family protein
MQRATLFILILWSMALCLAGWTLAQLPLNTIAQQISSLTLVQWTLWLAVNGLTIVLLTLRWQLLAHALQAPVKFFALLLVRQAGQTISFITPGPQFGGEPLQIYWLHKYGAPLRKAILSLGLDRFFELWVNFSVLVVAACLWLLGANNAKYAIGNWHTLVAPLLIILCLMLALAALLITQPPWINRRFDALAQRWQHNRHLRNIHEHWQTLGDDLRLALRTQKIYFGAAILLSLLGWVALMGELLMIFHLVNIELKLQEFLLILIALRMALLLPMPGGVGTIEASMFWAIHNLQLPASAAIGAIALMRLRDALVLIVGLICLKIQTTKKAATTQLA